MKIVFVSLLFILFFTAFGRVSAADHSDVIINEIAWMGTELSGSDEWIELKNNTGQKINLDGWILKAADGAPEIILAGTVPANGFYLLERTDDDALAGIAASQIYSGALENGGEILELRDNSENLIDKIDASGGWPAGDNQTKQTMEKAGSGWQTSQKPGGTPGVGNSKVLEKPSAPPASAKALAGKQAGVFNGPIQQIQDESSSKSFYVFLTAFALAVFSGTAIIFLKNVI